MRDRLGRKPSVIDAEATVMPSMLATSRSIAVSTLSTLVFMLRTASVAEMNLL